MFLGIIEKLKKGDIGVIPTDTLYGIVASTRIPEAVERVYRIRGRDTEKPCIILLSDVQDLEEFGIMPTHAIAKFLQEQWPGGISVVLPCASAQWTFLHRGTGTLAFRVPNWSLLRSLLRETGPLIAPSANIQGQPPAQSIVDAQRYFETQQVDFYVDAGILESEPSTLVRCEGDLIRILRPGKVKL